ncbi:hypothetical protein SAMN05216226_1077 [Halovenus aranensis]|jgi:hypothetical protein|uniref:Uncharacterized protein n=1 Tax=Halovenus aranensis TaxID=890420 RepID=A0A1G8VMV6_9EURY|nr:hypothetical protein [Halovenus aranensis]SDJ66745.1 hypothetical protein SAMN05216226_1077 [Halovenus aranensis]
MSSSSLSETAALLGARPDIREFVVRPIRRLAFWAAIVLPFLHLSLLVSGLESRSTTLAFVALVILNTVAVYVGSPQALE